MSFDLGAAVGGLASGMSFGKSIKGASILGGSKVAARPPTSTATGFGIGQNLVSGDVGSAEIATPTSDNNGWSALSKIVSTISGEDSDPGSEGQDQQLAGAGLGILKKFIK